MALYKMHACMFIFMCVSVSTFVHVHLYEYRHLSALVCMVSETILEFSH